MPKPAKTKEDYASLAKEHQLRWMSGDIPHNTHHHTMWQCKACYFRFPATFQKIRQGRGCPNCAGCRKFTLKDYQSTEEELNLRLASPVPESIKTPVIWEGPGGTKEEISLYNLRRRRK